jgi:hypothetical protein
MLKHPHHGSLIHIRNIAVIAVRVVIVAAHYNYLSCRFIAIGHRRLYTLLYETARSKYIPIS